MEFNYDIDPLDPDEEERKRQAALSALAAASAPPSPEPMVDRDAPVALPEQVSPPARDIDIGTLEINAPEAEPPMRDPDELPAPEDERKFRAAEALAAQAEPSKGLDSPARSPEMKEAAPVATPQTPTAQSPVSEAKTERELPAQQDPFEALMLRGEEMRRKQLEEYDKRGAPGVNGWALLADVAFNHGRSIPGILSQADADKRRYEEGRQKLMTGGGAHGDPVNQMIAYGNLQARQATGTRLSDKDAAAAEADKNGRAAFMSSWDKYLSPEEKETLANAPAATFRTLSGQLRDRIKNSKEYQEEHARGQGLDAAARTTSTIDAENAGKDVKADTVYTTETARRKAEAEQLGTRPETPAQIAAREHQVKRDAESDRRAAEAEARAARIEQRTNETLSATRQQTFGKSVEKALPVALELEKVEGLIAGHKAKNEAVPGIGIGGHQNGLAGSSLTPTPIRDAVIDFSNDPKTRKEALEATTIRGYISNFEQDLIHNRSGAAFNANEEQMNKITAGSRVGAPLEAVEAALQAIHEIVQTKIGGFASVAPSEAHSFMTSAGLTPNKWGIQAPAQQTQPSAAPVVSSGSALPPPPPPTDALPVTPQKSNQIIKPKDYLHLNDEDDDLGVSYGR